VSALSQSGQLHPLVLCKTDIDIIEILLFASLQVVMPVSRISLLLISSRSSAKPKEICAFNINY